MTPPPKSLAAQIDQAIDTDITFAEEEWWELHTVHEQRTEIMPEQMELINDDPI